MATRWLAVLALVSTAVAAQPAAPQLQTATSEIAFTTRQMGVPVEGRFTRFSARLALDPKNPQGGAISLAIDTASARFGSPELDAELPKATWLDAARFPQARFESATIQAAGPGRFDVRGQLTIKGRPRAIDVPVQLQPMAGGLVRASGGFTLRRLDFVVGDGEWSDTALLANEVVVRFRLVFSGLAAP